tara:strand:- start:225 stop:893 length:669 start_codon:yes stop_codon:yes gene_type:complete
MINSKISFHGDSTVIIKFGDEIDEDLNILVHKFLESLVKGFSENSSVLDIYPTYNSIIIDYDPNEILYENIKQKINSIKSEFDSSDNMKKHHKIIEIPVQYGDDFGPDLKRMSKTLNISEEKIIQIHSSTKYRVHMIGFMPGFPYLGGLDSRISFPRLDEPRLAVPEGSVGIAGDQTGIYPFSSPGGWNIIGRTNLRLFDSKKNPPNLIISGSYIKFKIQND